MNPKSTKKLRALVYTGLAGGLVGVSTYSAAAHGNITPYNKLPENFSWMADDVVVKPDAKQTLIAEAK